MNSINQQDYRAVVSQIKREALIEFSGVATNQNNYDLNWDTIPDHELNILISQATQAARRRGMLGANQQPFQTNYPQLSPTQTFLALLLLPNVRDRFQSILRQSVLEGLGLVEEANSLLAKTKANIVSLVENPILPYK